MRRVLLVGLAVELLAEADPDAGEDDAAASLSDEFGGMDEIEVAEACSAMVFDLCDGPTSETFDQPLQGCSGRE